MWGLERERGERPGKVEERESWGERVRARESERAGQTKGRSTLRWNSVTLHYILSAERSSATDLDVAASILLFSILAFFNRHLFFYVMLFFQMCYSAWLLLLSGLREQWVSDLAIAAHKRLDFRLDFSNILY